jgi:hypothetical protein
MKNNPYLQKIIDEIAENFTDDALFLVQSYFKKLVSKMEESGVPEAKQKFILNGLHYYLNEFIEDYTSQKKIISFESTLEILNEIGSPTEIIQTLSFTRLSEMDSNFSDEKVERTSTERIKSPVTFEREVQRDGLIRCRYCHTMNEKSSNYCDNCGNNLFSQGSSPQNFKQDLIDHNYFITFILCWITFAAVNIIIYVSFDVSMWSLLFPDVHIRKWGIPFPEDLAISMLFSIIPAIVTAIIGGYLLDELFFVNLKSQKQKYRQALENLHGRFFVGVWFFVFGILIFTFLSLNGFNEFVLPLMPSLFFYGVMFWKQFFGEKPYNMPYFKILSTKRSLDNHVKDKFFIFNPVSILVSFILAVFWAFLSNSFLHPELEAVQLLLAGGLVMISLFVFFNGYFFIYYYDWSYILRYSRQMNGNHSTPNFLH